jgi:hypothetical protein
MFPLQRDLNEGEFATLNLDDQEDCLLEFDCDSIYFGSHKFEEIINACGEECIFHIDSLIERTKSSDGFRFQIDTSNLVIEPIIAKSAIVQKVDLSLLPNVKIAECNNKALFGHSMAIYISYIGPTKLRKTNMFKNEELAIIISAMNYAKRLLGTDEDLNETDSSQLSNLPVFETKVDCAAISSVKKNTRGIVGRNNMVRFAEAFTAGLHKLAEDEPNEEYYTSQYLGMSFLETLDSSLNFTYMKQFAKDLAMNHYFTASCAGFKNIFKTNDLTIDLSKKRDFDGNYIHNLDRIHGEVQTKVDKIYNILRREVFQNVNFGNMFYFVDIAVTLIPRQKDHGYLLKGPEMKRQMIRDINLA